MPKITRRTGDKRMAAMRGLMKQHDVDALIFGTADFFEWATNFHVDVRPWERPIYVVVPFEGKPFAIMNELSEIHMRFARQRDSVWLDQVDFYAEHPMRKDPWPVVGELPEMIADRLREAGLSKSRIGVDGLGGPLGRAVTLLSDARFSDMTAVLRGLRWVKGEEELAAIEAICGLTDWVQDRYRENIRPGRLLQEMDFSMAALMAEEGAKRFPGEALEILLCWTMSGPASASPHGDGASCGQRIQTGEVLINIVVPRLNGIVVENERTWFCGKPTAEQARFYEVARGANEASIEAAVTGRPVSGIDAAARKVFEDADCDQYIRHRTGHGMGILGHEYPEDMAFNHRALLADEMYSAEPGIYVWGLGGFRIDDTVIVGDQPRVLTKTPKSLDFATIA